MSAFGLAQNLGIERAAAQSYMDKYFARYPGVAQYMERTRWRRASRGAMSRRSSAGALWLPDINSSNRAAPRGRRAQAINAPMQGTAADLIKLAMIAVQAGIERRAPSPPSCVMQVHDELVLEVPGDRARQVKSGVERLMMGARQLDVPLVVEAGVGPTWGEAKS